MKMEESTKTVKNDSDIESDQEIDYNSSELVKCRYYRNKVPQKDEVVAVITTDIKDLGAYVTLVEYGGIEGFIMLSQVTAKRVKTVKKLLNKGKQEFMEVLRVDEEKMCIDLSKKSLKTDGINAASKRLKKSQQVHQIMRQTAIKLKTPVEQLYEQFGWDLYDKCGFEHAFDAFRVAMTEPELVFSKVTITPEQQAVLLEIIHKKMTSNPLKIRVDFALTCTTFEGVDVIKEALLSAKHIVNVDGWKLEFKMIAPPNYKCEVVTHHKAEGESKLKLALKIIKDVMKQRGGHFKQKSEPTIIGSNSDEPDTADLLEKLKNRQNDENGEQQQDEDDDEDNDEGMGDVDIEASGAVDESDSDNEEKKQ